MRAWFDRLRATLSSAVFAPVLLKTGTGLCFVTVLALIGRGVFDPLGVATASARAAPAKAVEASTRSMRRSIPPQASSADVPPAKTQDAPTCPSLDGSVPRVILNSAREQDLVKLPGVGPKKAQAIIALRDKLKQFRRLEELMRVRGIKRRFIERLRPLVVLHAADCPKPATIDP